MSFNTEYDQLSFIKMRLEDILYNNKWLDSSDCYNSQQLVLKPFRYPEKT